MDKNSKKPTKSNSSKKLIEENEEIKVGEFKIKNYEEIRKEMLKKFNNSKVKK